MRLIRNDWRGTTRTALGPLALAVYGVSQYWGTNPNGLGLAFWTAIVAIGAAAILAVYRRITSTQAMAIEVLACSLVTDWQFSTSDPLRDFNLYVNAGAEFVAGRQPYTLQAIHQYPAAGGHLPFLYAPPTLPFFGLLSVLPYWLVASAWVVMSVAIIVLVLRSFGLSWGWALVALAWPPIEQGLFVGNVVIPSIVLLALAPRIGGVLGLGPLLKPQNGILWLWLVRQRAWRSIAASFVFVAAVVAITLPLTGIGSWLDWVKAMVAYQESQQLLSGLYGSGLGRWLPTLAFVPLAVAVVAVALIPRGRKGLSRLGTASVVASPSLWNHGFVFMIPELLRLRGQWFWLTLGLTVGKWPGPQMAMGIVVAGWFFGPLLHRLTARFLPATLQEPATHPLGRRAVQLGAPSRVAPEATLATTA